jgi:hypothetical protein
MQTAMLEREYQRYRIGCLRLGAEPLPLEAFEARWEEFEAHAERLKEGEAAQSLTEIAPALRAEMQRRIQSDPFVRAILIGMAEENSAP